MARMAQGFALGGEVGPTTAYLMEIAPPERRALVVSWQPASQQIAATAGALVGVILEQDDGARGARCLWLAHRLPYRRARLPFGLWMRRTLPETIAQG